MRLSRDNLLTILLVIAALGLGSVVTSRLPQPDDVMNAPFLRSGGPGDRVELRTMSYTLTGVDAAKRVDAGLRTGVSTGLWLVVSLEATPRSQPGMPSNYDAKVVAADGREFEGLTGLGWVCRTIQTGTTETCQLAFEVAPDALAGARLRVPASIYHGVPDDIADIDLGIDEARQAQLVAASDRVIKLVESKQKGA